MIYLKVERKVSGKDRKIVFPEALDERVLTAAGRLAEGVITPSIVGNMEQVQAKARN